MSGEFVLVHWLIGWLPTYLVEETIARVWAGTNVIPSRSVRGSICFLSAVSLSSKTLSRVAISPRFGVVVVDAQPPSCAENAAWRRYEFVA